MKTPSSAGLENLSWPVYSAAVLFLCAFFQVMQWPLLPKFLDIYYHLGVMKGFADAGGYVTRAFWEYAPAGRPHLYPPVLHILMLAAYKAGCAPIDIGRAVDCLSYPLFLLSFHRLGLKIQSPRGAFLSLLLLYSVFSMALASVTLSAFNLAVIFGLWGTGFIEKRKCLAAGLCLALCFYTHTLAAWLFVLTLLVYAFLRRELAPAIAKAATGALVLAAPFLAYQFHHRDFFSFVKVHEFRRWEFDACIVFLAVCGTVYFAKNRSLKSAALPLALIAGFSPLVITHPTRFFNGYGLIGSALLSGLFVDEILRRWGRKASSKKLFAGFLTFAAFTALAGPFFEWNAKEREGRWVWADRTLTRYLVPDEKLNFRAQGFSIFFQEDYEKIVELVRAHSGPEDILWTDFSYTAGILGLLADRATSCAMLAEVKPYEQSNRLQDAGILVWFKDKNLEASPEMGQAIEKYHFSVLAETDMAFVLKNGEGYGRRRVPKPLVPTAGLFCLLAAAFGVVIFSSRTARNAL